MDKYPRTISMVLFLIFVGVMMFCIANILPTLMEHVPDKFVLPALAIIAVAMMVFGAYMEDRNHQ